MNEVFPILQIKSKEDFLKISELKSDKIIDTGNGFWITNDGYLVSVAHVLKNNKKTSSYGFIKDKLFKIKIITRIQTKENENHADAAIGKIDLKVNDFIDIKNSIHVLQFDNLKIIGYSKYISNGRASERMLLNNSKFNIVEIQAICMDTNYFNSKKSINMNNFFTIVAKNHDYRGMSGCPIMNENNKVVGVLKAGAQINNTVKGQILHIKIINELLTKLNMIEL